MQQLNADELCSKSNLTLTLYFLHLLATADFLMFHFRTSTRFFVYKFRTAFLTTITISDFSHHGFLLLTVRGIFILTLLFKHYNLFLTVC